MNIDFSNTAQATAYFEEKKFEMYETAYKFAVTSNITNILARIHGFTIALGSAVLTLAQRVARVGECLFKGIINIAGSLLTKEKGKYDLSMGAKQLLLQLPSAISELVFAAPIYIGVGLIVTPIAMLIAPVQYSRNRAKAHLADRDNLRDLTRPGGDQRLLLFYA